MKAFAALLFAAFALAGCKAVKRSPAFSTALRARHAGEGASYSARLHAALARERIEHKVVVFAHPIEGQRHGRVMVTRTVVVYRDARHAAHPWWAAGDRVPTPVWLPAGTLEQQLGFLVRAPITLVSIEHFGAPDGKAIAAAECGDACQVDRPGPITRLIRSIGQCLGLRRSEPASAAPAPAPRKEPVTRLEKTR